LSQTRGLAASLGLEDRVRFLGQRKDVDRILADAQVGLLITNWEGLPLSILEAMRANLPVVASDVGGVSESVTDGVTGYVVPKGDVDVLRERLRRLLSDPELRAGLGMRGRAEYETHFALERSVSKTLAVYESVLRRPLTAAGGAEDVGGAQSRGLATRGGER
jgi:glycosyltransferase involved in cell wall biosynthesis